MTYVVVIAALGADPLGHPPALTERDSVPLGLGLALAGFALARAEIEEWAEEALVWDTVWPGLPLGPGLRPEDVSWECRLHSARRVLDQNWIVEEWQ